MSQIGIFVRPATAADRTEIVALAPRLAEGVAPWRDQGEAGNAGRRWLEGSLDDAAAGTGTVFVAVDAAAATEAAGDAAEPAVADRLPAACAEDAALGQAPSVGGRVVGVLSIRPTQHFTGERDGYIGELVVAERAERRGVGRSLIAVAEAWARD
jgi:GNAT superfamily N-acetyltransferase